MRADLGGTALEAGIALREIVAEHAVVEIAALFQQPRLDAHQVLDHQGQEDERQAVAPPTDEESHQAGETPGSGRRPGPRRTRYGLSRDETTEVLPRKARSIRPPSKGSAGIRLTSIKTQFR